MKELKKKLRIMIDIYGGGQTVRALTEALEERDTMAIDELRKKIIGRLETFKPLNKIVV